MRGDQQHAGGVAVQAMHQRGTVAALVGERGQHAVDVVPGARPALHGEAEGLVEHEDVAILQEDHGAQGTRVVLAVARLGVDRRGSRVQVQRRHADALPRLQPGGGLDAGAVDADLPGADDLVEVRQREAGHPPLEPAVEAHAGFVVGDRQGLGAQGRASPPAIDTPLSALGRPGLVVAGRRRSGVLAQRRARRAPGFRRAGHVGSMRALPLLGPVVSRRRARCRWCGGASRTSRAARWRLPNSRCRSPSGARSRAPGRSWRRWCGSRCCRTGRCRRPHRDAR